MNTLQAVALAIWVAVGLLLLALGGAMAVGSLVRGVMCNSADLWPGGMRCEWVPDND